MGATSILNLTVEQYLDYDDTADCRTEFHDGEIFRMDDVSPNHGIIEVNLGGALRARLKESSCRPMAGVRFRAVGEEFVRPDLAVVCGQSGCVANGRALSNPTLVVEILSPSTADYDYGGKFELYRQMDSLQEYALVSQTRPRIEVFRKIATGEWLLSSYNGLEAVIPFPSLSLEIPMIELYAGIEF